MQHSEPPAETPPGRTSLNRTELRLFLVIGLLAALPACVSKQGPREDPGTGAKSSTLRFDPARGTASVSGKIAFDGPAPARTPLKLSADPACVAMHGEPLYSEEIVVNNARLQNVFVWVKQGLEKYSFETPAEPVTLTQQGCRYSPHVGGLMVNQKLRIVNSDPTLHNIHCMAENNSQFNLGQATEGMSATRSFATPEVMMRFKCDVHNWMTCYFGVVPHPYFSVSSGDGTYSLKGLPPGEYVIEAWHEKLGTRTEKVLLKDNEAKEANFTFAAEKNNSSAKETQDSHHLRNGDCPEFSS